MAASPPRTVTSAPAGASSAANSSGSSGAASNSRPSRVSTAPGASEADTHTGAGSNTTSQLSSRSTWVPGCQAERTRRRAAASPSSLASTRNPSTRTLSLLSTVTAARGPMTTYKQILTEIAAAAKKYDLRLQPPCSPKVLGELQGRARKQLGNEVPNGYVAFLRQHDGLDWNGLAIYAGETVPIAGYTDRFIQGFIEANLDFRDNIDMKRLLVFGESGLDLYVCDVVSKKYSARDRVSLDVNESFDSFDEMLAAALRNHL